MTESESESILLIPTHRRVSQQAPYLYTKREMIMNEIDRALQHGLDPDADIEQIAGRDRASLIQQAAAIVYELEHHGV